jgi:uncharacterized protein YyaL (SSP411 family)
MSLRGWRESAAASTPLALQAQRRRAKSWRRKTVALPDREGSSISEDANLLAGEVSPYLLQHAANPVHWRPWGAAAFAEAKRRDCPILLSVGYAACHWCHVMAHESFEDPEVAAAMNALFVNVKVDREERPDVDALYMAALHALGEQGGWPMTMFLSPDGAPFHGGTYWPPTPRWGRPAFRQVLVAVEAAWRDRRAALDERGGALVAHLAELAAPHARGALTPDDLTQASGALLRLVDANAGGLRGAPKFPNAPIFRFFWSEFFRRRDPALRAAVRGLLDALCAGGIYDHLGGGFARYSTDAVWLVPHFEKMLYDNAQILELLALCHAETPTPVYAARAHETFAWLMREMKVGDAFAASLDADSEGEEGRFYVWSAEEIAALLGEGAPALAAAYDVSAEGNWEGRNVLRRLTPPGPPAEEARLAAARALLLAARERRPRPGRDDKILADWNGLMIAALTRAAAVFAAPDYLAAAQAAFAYVKTNLRDERGRLLHAWRDGRAGAAALLDDYAAMARAALALFQATGAPHYLSDAIAWAGEAERRFGDGKGGVFMTAGEGGEDLIVRPRSPHDGAAPSGASLLAEVFATLHHLTLEPRWAEAAERLARVHAGEGETAVQAPLLLAAIDLLDRGGAVVIEGRLDDARASALADVALRAADPAILTLRFDPAVWPDGPPGDRPRLPTLPAAMLCRGQTCSLPVTSAVALRALLAAS